MKEKKHKINIMWHVGVRELSSMHEDAHVVPTIEYDDTIIKCICIWGNPLDPFPCCRLCAK